MRVKLSFRTTKGGAIHDVAFVDLLPAGLEPDIASVRSAAAESAWRPDYVDIREDRIVLYGTVSDTLESFTYVARAVNSGSFTVPPLFAEAMYDPAITAYKPQPAIKIGERCAETPSPGVYCPPGRRGGLLRRRGYP